MTTVTWMADAFRHNGLRVREVQGWKIRGRPGTFAPRGVIFHHTASSPRAGDPAPQLGTILKGKMSNEGFIHGPLANVLVARDGTVIVLAAGRANHAGKGGPFRNIPKNSGNSFLVGVEVENNGVGEKWSPQFLETLDVVFATLLIGLQRQTVWLIGHKEWAPGRKIDPARTDAGLPTMDKMRGRVSAEIRTIGSKHSKKPATGGLHVVKAGDTLFRIALEHHMSVAELMKLNGLTTVLIHPGDKLKVKS